MENQLAPYKYNPQLVLENSRIKLYWDIKIVPDRTVTHNRPDMIIIDKEMKMCTIIDFSIPLDDNLARANRDKMEKYQQLADEIRDMWEMQGIVIRPLIISANGIIHKNVTKHLAHLQVKQEVVSWMQKAVVLGTTAIVRRVLSTENHTPHPRNV